MPRYTTGFHFLRWAAAAVMLLLCSETGDVCVCAKAQWCFHTLGHNFQCGLELFMGLNLPGHKMKLYSLLTLSFSLFTLFLTWPWSATDNNTHCTLPIQGCVWETFFFLPLWIEELCGISFRFSFKSKAMRLFVMPLVNLVNNNVKCWLNYCCSWKTIIFWPFCSRLAVYVAWIEPISGICLGLKVFCKGCDVKAIFHRLRLY